MRYLVFISLLAVGCSNKNLEESEVYRTALKACVGKEKTIPPQCYHIAKKALREYRGEIAFRECVKKRRIEKPGLCAYDKVGSDKVGYPVYKCKPMSK